MKRILTLVAVLALVFCLNDTGICYPVMNQTGNLLENGNFESGNLSSWNQNDNPTVSISTLEKIDGNYSALINTTTGHTGNIGDWVVGLWQYPYPSGSLTASAWFLPLQGQAHVGISWTGAPTPPSPYHTFSLPTSSLGAWQYLEITAPQGYGALLFGLEKSDIFYVDGVWLNYGSVNLSPYAPQNGFTLPQPVPLPGAALLFGSGLTMFWGRIAWARRQKRT
jgi:hypothetical protein